MWLSLQKSLISNALNFRPLNIFDFITTRHSISIRTRKNLTILSSLIVLWSCEEIIQVDLKNVTPKIVIESFITNEEVPAVVKISKSQAFFNQSSFTSVKDAVVQLEYLSAKEKLIERGGGYYASSGIKGKTGGTYTLKITTNGEAFGAKVVVPCSVPIDTAYFQPSLFHSDSLNIFVGFKDPAITENYYRIKLYRNRRYAVNDYFLITDAFSDGENIVAPIYYRNFAPNDTVIVELLNLERCTWKYFKAISESIQQGLESQAPGNPPTNLTGGALGIFGAWGSSVYRIIAPQPTGKK